MSNLIYQWYFELKRRKVFRAALAYAAASWLLLQVTEIVAGAFALPDWTTRLVFILLLLGFPLVMALAWVFDVSPGGMVRTADRSGAMEWLAAVMWIHLPPIRDDVGNQLRRPRAALERRVLVWPSLWRRWQGDEAQLVFNSAFKAIIAGNAIRAFAASQGISLSIGIAVGSVRQTGEEIEGEAALVARELARAAPAGEIHGTEQVHDELIHAPEMGGEFVGPLSVAALAHPVRSYRLQWQEQGAGDEGNRRGGDRRSGEPGRDRARVRWPLAAAALVSVALIVGLVWQLQPATQPAAPVLPEMAVQAREATYVVLEPIDDPGLRLSEAERFGLLTALNQVFEYLPAVYPADSGAVASAAYILRTRVLSGNGPFTVGLQLRNRLSDAIAAELSVNEQGLQAVIGSAQEGLLAMLSTQLELKAESMPHLAAMPAQLFADLLDAQFALGGVPSLDVSARLEQTLASHVANGEDNVLLHATYCDLLIGRVQMLKDASALDRGEDSCRRIADSPAPTIEARLAFARYLKLRGRTTEAIREIAMALSVNPRNANAYDLLAQAYLDQGNPVQAELTLLKAITMQPGYWRPLRGLALFQFNAGRYSDAATTYRKLIQLAPNNGRAWSDLGAAHFMAGNLGEAADAFNRSVQLEPSQAALSNLGTLYYYLGRYNDAIRSYSLALEQSPGDFRLYGNLADVYRIQNDLDSAQRYYRQALEKLNVYLKSAAEDTDSRSLRLLYEFHLGARPAAYADMLALLQSQADNAEMQIYAAMLAKPSGDNDTVLRHLSRAVELGYSTAIISVDPEFTYLGSDRTFTRLISAQTR